MRKLEMAKLSNKQRKKIPSSEFGLPDKAHAANAKARATQQMNKGNLSYSDKMKIDSKADVMLTGKKRVK